MADVIIRDHSNDVRSALEVAKQKALIGIAHTAKGFCADELEMAPRRVDTGRLKTSINGRVQGNSAVISTNVEYAIYVHEGTRYMSPNRFLRNGIENNLDNYKKIIEYELKNTQI